MLDCFSFTILARWCWANPKGFHVAFSTTVDFTIRVEKSVWEFCQLVSISIPIIYSMTEEITTEQSSDSFSLLDKTLSADLINPTLTSGSGSYFRFPKISINSELVHDHLRSLFWVLSFPKCTVVMINGHGRRFTVYIHGIIAESFLK